MASCRNAERSCGRNVLGLLHDHTAPARHGLHIKAEGLVGRPNPQCSRLHHDALSSASSIAHLEMKIFRVTRDGDVMPHGHHVFHMPALVFAHFSVDAIPPVGFGGGKNLGMRQCGQGLLAALLCFALLCFALQRIVRFADR